MKVSKSSLRIKVGEVRFSLSAIKVVGDAAVSAIIEEREKIRSLLKNLGDLIKRVSSRALNKKAVESLAAAGAFDCFQGIHRAQYFATLSKREYFSDRKGHEIRGCRPGPV
jgi:DNA polymerase-3 subunit alpha